MPGIIVNRLAHRAALAGIGGLLLAWPAIWNGYPLVFADTGTYVSQAVNHHLGWDRPVFYSFFLLALHWRISLWPVVAVQAVLALWLLTLACRVLAPGLGPIGRLTMLGVLGLGTALPWFASQVMPDLFTPLLALAIAIAVLAPDGLRAIEAWALAGFTAFAIAIHQSHVPLALGLIAALLILRPGFGAAAPLSRAASIRVLGPPVLAMAALTGVNAIGHHRISLSPYGNVFLLARVLYDGPGRDALMTDCPRPGWRLCAMRNALPDNADDFLWRADSPLARAGGAIIVSREADGIIAAAIAAEPLRETRIMAENALRQLTDFATGDGLTPWPDTVTPWLRADFPPAEFARYQAARQTRGAWLVPGWMLDLHRIVALIGIAGCCLLVLRRRAGPRAAGFAAVALLALGLNAAITGALSGPHDRYQARLVWIAPAVALLGLAPRRSVRMRPVLRTPALPAA